jgi:DNA-binding HxlR family transcriptional regulator
MTARDERSVPVVPGATEDRRESGGRARAQRNARRQYRSHGTSPRLTSDLKSLAREPNVVSRSGASARDARHKIARESPNQPLASERSGPLGPQLAAHSYASYDTLQLLHELSGRATIQTWLFLYWEGPANASQIRRLLKPGQEAIDGALNRLARARLVHQETLQIFPLTKVYSLTKRGRKLVETPIPSWPAVIAQ